MMSLRSTFYVLRTRSAFTLVEVVIYIGLFALMAVFVGGALFNLGSSAGANRTRIAVQTEADFALRKVSWAFAGGRAINEPAVNTTSTVLSINKFDSSENPIVFSLASGTLMMQRGAGIPTRLLSENVRVANLVFTHVPEVIGEPESLNMILSVAASSSDPAVTASTTLRSTFYLRK